VVSASAVHTVPMLGISKVKGLHVAADLCSVFGNNHISVLGCCGRAHVHGGGQIIPLHVVYLVYLALINQTCLGSVPALEKRQSYDLTSSLTSKTKPVIMWPWH